MSSIALCVAIFQQQLLSLNPTRHNLQWELSTFKSHVTIIITWARNRLSAAYWVFLHYRIHPWTRGILPPCPTNLRCVYYPSFLPSSTSSPKSICRQRQTVKNILHDWTLFCTIAFKIYIGFYVSIEVSKFVLASHPIAYLITFHCENF